MKNANNSQISQFSLRVLLSICLMFCQFQPDFVYKSIDFLKQTCNRHSSIAEIHMGLLIFQEKSTCAYTRNMSWLFLYIAIFGSLINVPPPPAYFFSKNFTPPPPLPPLIGTPLLYSGPKSRLGIHKINFVYFAFPLFYVTRCDALHDLVPFVQFKKREKHLW